MAFLFPSHEIYAAEQNEDIDFGEPIQVRTYEDENGYTVVEKTYFAAGQEGITPYDKSGNGWYKNEKTYTWDKNTSSEKVMTYYAKGYFSWGDDDVNVSRISGDVSGVPSNVTISNKKTTSGKGKYGALFNNYAYVSFSFTAKNPIGNTTDFSVMIRVSESGNTF